MYKCCWNCQNGITVCALTKEETEQFNRLYRLCCASYPVSSHRENPFKKRYCKQFEERAYFPISRQEITKEEADFLLNLTKKQIIDYWENANDQ